MNTKRMEAEAAWRLLNLSETGYQAHELIAQFAASYVLSAESNAAELFELERKVSERVMNLLMDPSEVWMGLLPGGPLPDYWPDWSIVESQEYDSLKLDAENFANAAKTLDAIKDTLSRNREKTGDAMAWEALGEIAVIIGDQSKSTWPGDEIHSQRVDSRWTYAVAIIVNPDVRHDESTDLIDGFRNEHAESVLDLAYSIKKRIESFDVSTDWPAEELAGYIVHQDGEDKQTWVMTWDNAEAIIALHELMNRRDVGDDIAQSIQDDMARQGSNYIPFWS